MPPSTGSERTPSSSDSAVLSADLDPHALAAGERQLLTLVRSYISPARLVILDEATCHLGPAAEARVERAFADRDGSLLVIGHRISSALRARRVLLLDTGHDAAGQPGRTRVSGASSSSSSTAPHGSAPARPSTSARSTRPPTPSTVSTASPDSAWPRAKATTSTTAGARPTPATSSSWPPAARDARIFPCSPGRCDLARRLAAG